jgi:hypothetical protein
VQHAVRPNVVDIAALTADESTVFYTLERLANESFSHEVLSGVRRVIAAFWSPYLRLTMLAKAAITRRTPERFAPLPRLSLS